MNQQVALRKVSRINGFVSGLEIRYKQKMKILYSHYLNDRDHPAARMVEEISQQLRELGHEVLVHGVDLGNSHEQTLRKAEGNPKSSSQFQSRERSSKEVPAYAQPMGQRLRRKLWFAKAMARNRNWYSIDKKAMRKFQPDIVLARQDAYCWSTVKAARNFQIPVVTFADAPIAYESRTFNLANRFHPYGLVERIENWGFENSEAIITISNPSRARLKMMYGKTLPVNVVSNGIDPEKYPKYSLEEKEQLRKELGLKTPLVLGFQGTFKAFHGIERLSKLIQSTAENPDVSWLLIGDGPERASLQESTQALQNVRFLGRRPPAEISKLLSVIDVAIAPHSQMEGDFYFCPLKIIEYAASGCAILASDQGDIPRILDFGNAGEIVGSDRLASWILAMNRLVRNREHAQQLGAKARQHIFENYTWRHAAAKVEEVLSTVLTPPTGLADSAITEPEPVEFGSIEEQLVS